MAEKSFPWLAVGGDRTVAAADAKAFYGSVAGDGVLTGLTTTKKNSSTVTLAAGVAVVQGRVYVLDAAMDLSPAAGNRKDYVVLKLDESARTVTAVVKQGTGSDYPSLQRDASVWELALVAIDNSVGTFLVTDTTYDPALCGRKRSIVRAQQKLTADAASNGTGWRTVTGTGLSYLTMGAVKAGDVLDVDGAMRAMGTAEFTGGLAVYSGPTTELELFSHAGVASGGSAPLPGRWVADAAYADIRVYMRVYSTANLTIKAGSGTEHQTRMFATLTPAGA